MTRISVISAVYDKARHLPQVIENLRGQTGLEGAAEFVFADDASTDASVAILEAMEDPRIRVIRNAQNAGPAIRFNQAAAAAKGEWLLPMDADDRLSANAMATFLHVAQETDADIVFARNARGQEPLDIPADPTVSISDDPLTTVATRKIVRMGYLVRAALWHEAGGADERVFIQDQSLPLRLAAQAKRIVFLEHTAYWLSAADDGNLSANTAQQHHDRFLTMAHMLETDPPLPARRAIERQMISAYWKMNRDGAPGFGGALPAYLLNRVLGRGLSEAAMVRARAAFAALPGIRRPD